MPHRIKLQFKTGSLPHAPWAEKCWLNLPDGLATVNDLHLYVADQFLSAALHTPYKLHLHIDGFALLPAESISILRDGDLVTVDVAPAALEQHVPGQTAWQNGLAHVSQQQQQQQQPKRGAPVPSADQPASKKQRLSKPDHHDRQVVLYDNGNAAAMPPNQQQPYGAQDTGVSPSDRPVQQKAATQHQTTAVSSQDGDTIGKGGSAKVASRSARRKALKRKLRREGVLSYIPGYKKLKAAQKLQAATQAVAGSDRAETAAASQPTENGVGDATGKVGKSASGQAAQRLEGDKKDSKPNQHQKQSARPSAVAAACPLNPNSALQHQLPVVHVSGNVQQQQAALKKGAPKGQARATPVPGNPQQRADGVTGKRTSKQAQGVTPSGLGKALDVAQKPMFKAQAPAGSSSSSDDSSSSSSDESTSSDSSSDESSESSSSESSSSSSSSDESSSSDDSDGAAAQNGHHTPGAGVKAPTITVPPFEALPDLQGDLQLNDVVAYQILEVNSGQPQVSKPRYGEVKSLESGGITLRAWPDSKQHPCQEEITAWRAQHGLEGDAEFEYAICPWAEQYDEHGELQCSKFDLMNLKLVSRNGVQATGKVDRENQGSGRPLDKHMTATTPAPRAKETTKSNSRGEATEDVPLISPQQPGLGPPRPASSTAAALAAAKRVPATGAFAELMEQLQARRQQVAASATAAPEQGTGTPAASNAAITPNGFAVAGISSAAAAASGDVRNGQGHASVAALSGDQEDLEDADPQALPRPRVTQQSSISVQGSQPRSAPGYAGASQRENAAGVGDVYDALQQAAMDVVGMSQTDQLGDGSHRDPGGGVAKDGRIKPRGGARGTALGPLLRRLRSEGKC